MPNKSGLLVLFLAVMLWHQSALVAYAGGENKDQTGGISLPLEGETGVTSEIEEAFEEHESIFGAPLQSYLDWKEDLRDRPFGLSPTMGATGIGALGAVIKGDLPGGFWLDGTFTPNLRT